MKVCHTVFHEMPVLSSWDELAERFPGIAHLLLAQQEAGLQLSWIASSAVNRTFFKDRVKIKFLRIPRFFNQRRQDVGWNQARIISRAIMEEKPEVIHQHGLNSWMALRVLRQLRREHEMRCIVQDHGGGVPASEMKQWLYKKSFGAIRYVVFGDAQTRDLWISRDLFAPEKCQILFAASSVFKPVDEQERRRLRQQLPMEGEPILGWVAHLDRNKDPLTILRACAAYFKNNPAARLYMHFIKDDLRGACEKLIDAHPALRSRVSLRGSLPHAQLESFYQSIDYFVQGSHHEAYGYSVAEAISTGAIPIVTDIPSFRLLCDDGRCGYLFPPGDAAALQQIFLKIPKIVRPDERARAIQRFVQEFSYPAIAKKFLTLYQ